MEIGSEFTLWNVVDSLTIDCPQGTSRKWVIAVDGYGKMLILAFHCAPQTMMSAFNPYNDESEVSQDGDDFSSA
jgi:hypothetical protein